MYLYELGKSAQEAAAAVCEHMSQRMQKTIMVGAIIVSIKGEVGIYFSTKHMPWAYQVSDELHHGINQNEDICEKVLAVEKWINHSVAD